LGERVTLGAPFFWGCGEREGLGVSVGLGDGVSSGLGVGDFLLCFRGVEVGDGVGELFLCFGEAVGDGLGVAFVAELFLCLRFGAGVGEAKIFLIFVPNESSAALAVSSSPSTIEKIKSAPTNLRGAIDCKAARDADPYVIPSKVEESLILF
jgi:hypothetical protein